MGRRLFARGSTRPNRSPTWWLAIAPSIVSTKSSLHPLLVLLAFLGGGLVAGISGFFLAPAMIGVVTGIYQVVAEERKEEKERAENKKGSIGAANAMHGTN